MIDLENFEFDEQWLREAARIEDETGCDIEAGMTSDRLDQYNRIRQLREAIGPIDFDVVQALREVREGED